MLLASLFLKNCSPAGTLIAQMITIINCKMFPCCLFPLAVLPVNCQHQLVEKEHLTLCGVNGALVGIHRPPEHKSHLNNTDNNVLLLSVAGGGAILQDVSLLQIYTG